MLNKTNINVETTANLSYKKVAIVQAKFNIDVTNSLVNGALNVLKKYQINIENKDIYLVPGAFEIPYMVNRLLGSQYYDAIICIGCLIKGKSDHYDSTRIAVTNELCRLSCSQNAIIVNGILNVHNYKQALLRSGLIPKSVNLGSEYAYGLCQMWIENENKNV